MTDVLQHWRSSPNGLIRGRGWRGPVKPVVVVVLVSGLFSFWQEYRIEQTLAALQKLLPQQVSVLRDGISPTPQ